VKKIVLPALRWVLLSFRNHWPAFRSLLCTVSVLFHSLVSLAQGVDRLLPLVSFFPIEGGKFLDTSQSHPRLDAALSVPTKSKATTFWPLDPNVVSFLFVNEALVSASQLYVPPLVFCYGLLTMCEQQRKRPSPIPKLPPNRKSSPRILLYATYYPHYP